MKSCRLSDDERIKPFLHANQEIFIQIIDTFWYGPLKKPEFLESIEFYSEGTGENIDSMMVIKNNQVYVRLAEDALVPAADILNSYSGFFSMYGETKLLTRLTGLLRFKQRSHIDYYVMRLDLTACAFSLLDYDGFYCMPVDISHYNKLKKLQHLYNMEEVYKGDPFYPYKREMRAFKEKLRIRHNFAVFTRGMTTKAVSKIYTNAQSHDAYQVGGVYTLKKYRKKGLSYFCLQNLLQHLAGHKKRYVYLFVNKLNIPAINLYKKAGFKTIAESRITYF